MARVSIRSFSSADLMFNESETRTILIFLFPSRTHNIKSAKMTDLLRSFAQGALLAAVDSSYAFSFVNALYGVALRPNVAAKKVITKFGKKATKSWFKHAKPKDLENIQIFDTVRDGIAYNFGGPLDLHIKPGFQAGLKVRREYVAYFKFAHELKRNATV